MNIKLTQNLHTHTTYCDGKNTPEELILEGLEKGFTSIGFSAHTLTPFVSWYCMTEENTIAYKKEIRRLKEKYKGVMDVYLGAEQDYFSIDDLDDYEYVIGSVHYLNNTCNDDEIDIKDPKVLIDRIDRFYDGNPLALARKYYELVALLPSKLSKLDVIGHYDLILKSSEIEEVIDTKNPTYRKYALDSMEYLSKKGYIFEVNTGAVARGIRSNPYPESWLLKHLREFNGKIVITSDCHYKEKLDFYFEQAIEYVKSCGFNEVCVFNGKSFDLKKI